MPQTEVMDLGGQGRQRKGKRRVMKRMRFVLVAVALILTLAGSPAHSEKAGHDQKAQITNANWTDCQ